MPNVLPDKRRPTSPQGRADVEGCESLLDALDETYTSWMRDIRLGKSRIVVPADALEPAVFGGGRGAGKSFDADREVFTELEVDPQHMDITPVQFDLRTAEHAETALHLFERIVSEAGYSPQTFGLKIEGRAESGTALRLREARTFKTMARKQRYWAPALADVCELLLILDGAIFGRPVTPERPRVTWPEETATPQEVAQTLTLLRTAEAASTETMVRMLHADWADEARARRGRAHPGGARRPRPRAGLLSVIDPDQLARLAQRLVERHRDAELAAFALVARRLAKRLDSEEWAAYQQLQAAGLSRDVRRIVQVLAKGRDAEVAALVTAAAGVGAREAALLLAESPAAVPPPTALAALTRDLAGRLAAADLRILRATRRRLPPGDRPRHGARARRRVHAPAGRPGGAQPLLWPRHHRLRRRCGAAVEPRELRRDGLPHGGERRRAPGALRPHARRRAATSP